MKVTAVMLVGPMYPQMQGETGITLCLLQGRYHEWPAYLWIPNENGAREFAERMKSTPEDSVEARTVLVTIDWPDEEVS